MTCHNCGATMENAITDLPFKIGDKSIVIIKKLPVVQCLNCNEFLLSDDVMEKVDNFLGGIDKEAELEVLTYAA